MPEKKELTEKQEAFCREYVKDFNSAQACIRSGYSKDTARVIGCNLLTKVNIQNRIAELLKDISIKNQIHESQIISELKKIAFSDISNYVNEDGLIKSFEDNDTTVISELNTIEMENEKKGYTKTSKKIKLYDKIKSLELLGRYKGIWIDRMKFDGEIKNKLLDKLDEYDKDNTTSSVD
jgi:phage terminase small subunit